MLPYIIAGIITVLIITLAALGYVKAPPDTAFIISGFRKPRILIGKAGIRIPFGHHGLRLAMTVVEGSRCF